jgi:putative ABC transport system permease protein
MNIIETILQSLQSIKENKLRSFLTLLSVAIGVFSIVGVGALVSSLNNTIDGKLSELGENTFIINKMPSMQMGGDDESMWKYRNRKNIDYRQFKELKRRMKLTDEISPVIQSVGFTVQYIKDKTDPDVYLVGGDEFHFKNNNLKIETGRAVNELDNVSKSNVVVIGKDIIVKLFKNKENPLGKQVKINNQQFTVIGTLVPKGAMMGRSEDNVAIIPVTTYLKYYSSEYESLVLSIKAQSKETSNKTKDEAIGILRSIRNVKPGNDNNFEVETSESLSNQFASFTGYLVIFGVVCGIISILAAGVGIMNIMLVAVKERTKEIGIRKAVGATRRWVLLQFIVESITISVIGGVIGIILGLGFGFLLSTIMNFAFAIPYNWVIGSIVICTILGVVSGYYPARKASNLDPIDALRYE